MPDQQIPSYLAEIGAGWRPRLLRLHEALMALAPDYRVEQVALRLGGLRIYLADRFQEDGEFDGAWADAAEDLVHAAEKAIESTCESCGSPGRIRFHGGQHSTYLRALCHECHTARLRDVSHAQQPESAP